VTAHQTLNGLQALGYIALKRQIVTVIDRKGLVSVASGFYGLAEAEYKTLMG
jgi:hypothetical protein